MTLDDNFQEFMENVDNYLKEQFDAHIEDITVLDGAVRVYVIDQHQNDIVWELRFKSIEGVDFAELSTTNHKCMVSLQPWAVGAILMS